jgi:transcriptional regulator with XRE-family HTH domain
MYNKAQRQWVLSHPEYWKEGVNACVYDAVVRYKEATGKKSKHIAEELGISPARLSQILNDGEANFTLDTLIRIALVTNHYPVIDFKEKEEFLAEEERSYQERVRFSPCNYLGEDHKQHSDKHPIPADNNTIEIPSTNTDTMPEGNSTYELAA